MSPVDADGWRDDSARHWDFTDLLAARRRRLLHTGDFDAAGRLEIVGRIADTIVTGGENVAPTAVEAVLLEHPDVVDAAVLGRPDPEGGRERSGRPAVGFRSVGAGRAHCGAGSVLREPIRALWVPRTIEIVKVITRGATAKIQRHFSV